MNAFSADWRTSPYASEFQPDEIDRLEDGSMVLCEECHWPRPAHDACNRCATYNVDQDRDGIGEFTDLT